MEMEKIVVCSAENAQDIINPLLLDGWSVKSVTSETVSVSLSGFNHSYDKVRRGYIIFVIEKQ